MASGYTLVPLTVWVSFVHKEKDLQHRFFLQLCGQPVILFQAVVLVIICVVTSVLDCFNCRVES